MVSNWHNYLADHYIRLNPLCQQNILLNKDSSLQGYTRSSKIWQIIPLFGERRRQNIVRLERENQSCSTIQKYGEDGSRQTPSPLNCTAQQAHPPQKNTTSGEKWDTKRYGSEAQTDKIFWGVPTFDFLSIFAYTKFCGAPKICVYKYTLSVLRLFKI